MEQFRRFRSSRVFSGKEWFYRGFRDFFLYIRHPRKNQAAQSIGRPGWKGWISRKIRGILPADGSKGYFFHGPRT
jgi:hypothetical protein